MDQGQGPGPEGGPLASRANPCRPHGLDRRSRPLCTVGTEGDVRWLGWDGCAVSASPAGGYTTSSPSWVLPSASRRGRTDFGMPALPPPSMPTTAMCAPCSSMPATPIRRPPCATTTTARTLPAAWLPAWPMCSEGIGMGKTAKKAADPAPPYTPTERERQAAQRVLDRRANKAPPPGSRLKRPPRTS